MRILMLGWEFPPFIAGGLGTACHGLTKALSRAGQDVLFVLPDPIHDDSAASHVRLLTPASIAERPPSDRATLEEPATVIDRLIRTSADPLAATPTAPPGLAPDEVPSDAPIGATPTTFKRIPADFQSPYPDFAGAADPKRFA
ncbi:MAG: glycogen/starch synthase, partial [Planctomycetota bacterium]